MPKSELVDYILRINNKTFLELGKNAEERILK